LLLVHDNFSSYAATPPSCQQLTLVGTYRHFSQEPSGTRTSPGI